MSNPACGIVTKKKEEVAKILNERLESSTGRSELFNGLMVTRIIDVMFNNSSIEEKEEYEEKTSPEDMADEVSEAYKSMLKEKAIEIEKAISNPVVSYKQLREEYTSEERTNRINMLSNLFSLVLDSLEKETGLDRITLCNGKKDFFYTIGGEKNIFRDVYKEMERRYYYNKEGLEKTKYVRDAKAKKGEDTSKEDKIIEAAEYKVKEYAKIMQNWGALVSMARIALKETEGLKINHREEKYTDEAIIDDFNDNPIDDYVIEEAIRDGWMQITDQISSYGSLGERVRRAISTIPAKDDFGNVIRDDLGNPIFVNPIEAHQNLLETLRGMNNSLDMMVMLSMSEKADTKSSEDYMNIDILNLLKANPILKTQFFRDFKKNFVPYSKLSRKFGIKTILLNRVNANDAYNDYITPIELGVPKSKSTVSLRIGSELNTIDRIFTIDENGKAVVNEKAVKNLQAFIQNTFGIMETDTKTGKSIRIPSKTISSNFDSYGRSVKILKIMEVFYALGINIEAKDLKYIFKPSKFKERAKLLREITSLGTYNLGNASNGSSFIKFLTSTRESSNSSLEERIKNLLLFIESSKSKRLESSVRYFDKKGKRVTRYSDVTPSFLGNFMDFVKRCSVTNKYSALRIRLTLDYLSSPMFIKNGKILNPIIRELMESNPDKEDTFVDNFSMTQYLGDDKIPFEKHDPAQHMQVLWQFFIRDRALQEGSEYAGYPVFEEGDAGVCKIIKSKRYENDKCLEYLCDLAYSELERMKIAYITSKSMQSQNHKDINNFTKHSKEFSLLPFLNNYIKVEMTEDADHKVILTYTNKSTGEDITENNIKKFIQDKVESEAKEYKSKMEENGLLYSRSNKDGSEYYPNLSSGNIKIKSDNIDKFILNYIYNTKLAVASQLQMMTICTSFYDNTEDLQKRYKEIHAPGNVLDIFAVDFDNKKYSNDGNETVKYFDDIKVDLRKEAPEFMQVVDEVFANNPNVREAIYGTKKENSYTDGQGYRSLDGYRKVMGMAGLWTRNMESAYNKILDIRKNIKDRDLKLAEDDPNKGMATKEELKELGELTVVMQPIKPYWYGFEKYPYDTEKHVLSIPVQHKYAEAVLIPELLPKGTRIREIAEYINDVDKGIDLLCSTKCVKVGSWGSTSLDNDLSVKESLDKAYTHVLSYSNYVIQNNVPEHINSDQLFGTQVRKLIMDKIAVYKDYSGYFDGKTVNIGDNENVKLTGRNLVRFYNMLICANIIESYDDFRSLIENPSKLSNMLINITATKSRNSKDNLMAYELLNSVGVSEKEFALCLADAGLAHDVIAQILSEFRKAVNKQKIKGGSLVQVSAYGITKKGTSEDLKYVTEEYIDKDGNVKHNVLYAECEIPFALSYTDVNGKRVDLDYNDYCNPDGTLIMDGEISKLEKEFPGILDIIAYRIPTEKAYSMLNLKVVRFSRPEEGGIIKVPAQGTTIAGFDFDIDKLYFMRKEFVERSSSRKTPRLSKEDRNKVFEWIYKEYPNIWNALQTNKRLAGDTDSNTPLHKYWGNDTLTEDLDKQEYVEEAMDALSIVPSELEDNEDRWATYNFNKTPWEQGKHGKAVRNNMILEIIRQRLMDPETLKDRLTPGGFENAKDAAAKMRFLVLGDSEVDKEFYSDGDKKFNYDKFSSEFSSYKKRDPKPNYDPTDINTLIKYNEQNQIAAKLIGIAANHNSNHAFASIMKTFKLREAIVFGSFADSNRDFKSYSYDENGNEVVNSPGILLNASYNKDSKGNIVDPSLNVAEFLASSVDAVKAPVLNYLNLNTVTANSAALLFRLGYPMDDIGILLNQPAIKKICKYCFTNNSHNLTVAISSIKEEYQDKTTSNASPDALSLNSLASNIVRERKYNENPNNIKGDLNNVSSFAANQLEVIKLFEKIVKASEELSAFVSNTKFSASNAVPSSAGGIYSQQMSVDNYLESLKSDKSALIIEVGDFTPTPIDNGEIESDKEKYFMKLSNNPFAFEQVMYDTNRKLARKLAKYFPYETSLYKATREAIADISDYILNEDTVNDVHDDIITYYLSCQSGSIFDGRNRDYLLNDFPKELIETIIDNEELMANPLLSRMTLTTDSSFNYKDDEGNIVTFNLLNVARVGKLQQYEKDGLKDAWADLYKQDKINGTKYAEKLFAYCFYRLGLSFSPVTFSNLIPIELKESIELRPGYTYNQFLNGLKDGSITVDNIQIANFVKQFIVNHRDNFRFAFSMDPFSNNNFYQAFANKYIYDNGVIQNTFTLKVSDIPENDKSSYKAIIKDNGDYTTFKPCIVIGNPNSVDCLVYICRGGDMGLNKSSNGSMEYELVRTQGLFAEGIQKSIEYYNPNLLPLTETAKRKAPSSDSTLNIENNTSSPEEILKKFESAEKLGITKKDILNFAIRNSKGILIMEELINMGNHKINEKGEEVINVVVRNEKFDTEIILDILNNLKGKKPIDGTNTEGCNNI